MSRSNLQLALALLVAGLSSIWTRAGWRRIGRAITVWWDKPPTPVDAATYRTRIETCRHCPIFYLRLQTCGTPLRKELRGMGCYCHMPTAATVPAKTCWLDDTMGDAAPHGWIKCGCQPPESVSE